MSPADSEKPLETILKAEADLITADEELMRRILFGRKFGFHPKENPPVLLGAFMPRRDETEGISMNRRACGVEPIALKNAAPLQVREKCGVVSLLVEAVETAGLHVASLPEPSGLPGHVVIPELNSTDSESVDEQKRNRVRAWAQSLASAATTLIEARK